MSSASQRSATVSANQSPAAPALPPDATREAGDRRTRRARRHKPQIAQQLVIIAGTTANHIAELLNRLPLQNRVQLAAWAVDHPEAWHVPIKPEVGIQQA